MGFGAQSFGDQGVGCLSDTVVDKPIGASQRHNELQAHRLPQICVDLLQRASSFANLATENPPVNEGKRGDLGTVSKTGKLLQCLLRFRRQAVQLPNHEVRHVIGVTFGVYAIQVPSPAPSAMIEGEQSLIGKRINKLNDEKWITSRLSVN